MKKLFFLTAFCLTCIGTQAQGTINFANRVFAPDGSSIVDAPIVDVGGIGRLEGPRFLAQLYALPGEIRDLTAFDLVKPVGNSVPFLSGVSAGYWTPVIQAVPGGVSGSRATVVIRAWDSLAGPTYEDAKRVGAAAGPSLLYVTLGGDGIPPADLIGLRCFSVPSIPEPSIIALGLLGAGGLFFKSLFRGQRRS